MTRQEQPIYFSETEQHASSVKNVCHHTSTAAAPRHSRGATYPDAKALDETAVLRAVHLAEREAFAARCLGGGGIALGERLAVAAPRRVEPVRVARGAMRSDRQTRVQRALIGFGATVDRNEA